MIWLLSALSALATPTAAELKQAWDARTSAMDKAAIYPLKFSDDEWATMAKGKVAKRRDKLDGADRVIGAIYIPASMDAVWLATQDEHGQLVKGMVSEELPGSVFDKKLWYQSLDLPWPFAPRQWVIIVENNKALRDASNNQLWERTWDLMPNQEAQPAKSKLDNGVWIPVNAGGWMLAEVPDGIVAVYHVRSVIGGNVPDNAATSYAYMTVGGALKNIHERATTWLPSHYTAGHAPMKRPDGSPVPTF